MVACGYEKLKTLKTFDVWKKTVQRSTQTIRETRNEFWVKDVSTAEVSFLDEYGNRFALATITDGVWKLIEKDFSLLEAWGVDPLVSNTGS